MTHSYLHKTSAPRGNYSHMVMVREGELLMERCSLEKMEEMATMAAAATPTAAAATLGPPSSLDMVLQLRGLFPP